MKQLSGKQPFKVSSITEVHARYVREGRIRLDKSKLNGAAVTYHDPCQIARNGGVMDEPRFILRHLTDDFRDMSPDPKYNWVLRRGRGTGRAGRGHPGISHEIVPGEGGPGEEDRCGCARHGLRKLPHAVGQLERPLRTRRGSEIPLLSGGGRPGAVMSVAEGSISRDLKACVGWVRPYRATMPRGSYCALQLVGTMKPCPPYATPVPRPAHGRP